MKRQVAGCLAVLMLVPGCTQTDTPAASGPLPSASTPTTSSLLPERPRTFDLSQLDPCALIPEASRAELNLDNTPFPDEDASERTCSFRSSTGVSAAVFLVLDANAADTISRSGKSVTATATIGGFTVPLIQAPTGATACSGFVDTGNSQYLSVQANGGGRVPDSELCGRVQPMIKIVLDTLEKLQPS